MCWKRPLALPQRNTVCCSLGTPVHLNKCSGRRTKGCPFISTAARHPQFFVTAVLSCSQFLNKPHASWTSSIPRPASSAWNPYNLACPYVSSVHFFFSWVLGWNQRSHTLPLSWAPAPRSHQKKFQFQRCLFQSFRIVLISHLELTALAGLSHK